MALVHEFENSGSWLFKRRGWLPVLLIVAGIVMMYLGNRQAILFDLRDEMIFLGVSLFGQLIRILTVGFAPCNTSGRNTKAGQIADELNVTGIYSVVRHPLYLGNFFIILGPVLFLRSAWFAVVTCLIFWLYYERIMFAEEQFLRRKFGDVYDKWSETVSAFIPIFSKFIPPKLTFSVRNVLRREYHSFFIVFIIFTLLDLFRNYFLTEKIYLTRIWMYLFISAAFVWIVIRMIDKLTKWMEVKGR
ncbi:MAG: isoprenylcysteine carboxylmethyltransferase family protein [Bacteroidales bacterium]|nr:isoprenylcysteine carboxylmethyltransferase family protein [Bacteroidales bacterium]